MINYILLTIMMMMNILFCFLNHPLSLGMTLILQTITISLIMGLMNFTFWYSYILLLIMIGAMLILFIYMTSLTPNKKFKLNKMFYFLIFLMFTMMFMYYMNDMMTNFMLNYSIDSTSIYNMNFTNNFKNTEIKSMVWMYDINEKWMMFFMINYLLYTLFITVKIININKGMMRKI